MGMSILLSESFFPPFSQNGIQLAMANIACDRLTPAFAMKHGYSSVDEFKAGVQKKFSLLENGILDRTSTRLLLVNVSFPFFHGSSL